LAINNKVLWSVPLFIQKNPRNGESQEKRLYKLRGVVLAPYILSLKIRNIVIFASEALHQPINIMVYAIGSYGEEIFRSALVFVVNIVVFNVLKVDNLFF